MASETSWEHGSVVSAHDTVQDGLHASQVSNEKGNSDGVSPVVSAAAGDGNTKTEEELKKAAEDARKTKNAADNLEDGDAENSKKTGDTDTKLSSDHSGPGGAGLGKDGGAGGPGAGKSPLDAGVPSAQSPSAAAQPPQMPQMGGGGSPMGSGGGMPSFPQMTQNDMNNAPNRDALLAANRGMDGGSGGSLGEFTNDPEGRRAQELADKLVNHQPPIPYAWGGGHGGTPGPSQGTHDGGYADQCGDYRKRGVDCSGLARWMTHSLYGMDINGTSQSQYASGHPVSSSNARPGDLFFPYSASRPPHHVQVYVGNGMVIEAQKSGTFLKFSPIQGGEFRRFAH